MRESIQSKLFKNFMNFFPAYFCTGAKVLYISGDWKKAKIKLSLNFITRNYVGVIFGGSLYASIDPVYMLLFIKILGDDYIVWDKEASIKFKKPGNKTLYAEFNIDDEEVNYIKGYLENNKKLERKYTIYYRDKEGNIYAEFEKVLYFRKKNLTI